MTPMAQRCFKIRAKWVSIDFPNWEDSSHTNELRISTHSLGQVGSSLGLLIPGQNLEQTEINSSLQASIESGL